VHFCVRSSQLNDQDKQVEGIKEFRHKLMWLEMQLVEQLDVRIGSVLALYWLEVRQVWPL